MTMQSSYQSVSEQILTFNQNVVDLLSKLNQLMVSDESSITINITDKSGVIRQFNLPSFGYLKSEIDRLSNNLNSIYSINDVGSVIKTSSNNQYKKVVTIDLNKEPNNIDSLGGVSEFVYKKNWFFDGLLSPTLRVNIDLTDKIEDNIQKCLVRRYIIEFNKNIDGSLTTLGTSALNSFNSLFRNQSNISINSLLDWIATTPGVANPLDPAYDEQVFDLEPSILEYDGLFSVMRIEEDTVAKKLWYHLNTLSYLNAGTGEVKQLMINDELIINMVDSTTRYKIIEVSTTKTNPRVRLERVEGLEPIPVGVGTMKFYSPILYNKNVSISIGYNERNVIFIKPLNVDNNLLSKNWSLGTGFYTNDLRLSSDDSYNGVSMDQFYVDRVYDYGDVLQDLVAKKIPNKLSATPPIPTLDAANFKVVQINKHLTDTQDSNLLKNKHNQQKSIKSEIQQIEEAIVSKNKQLTVVRFTSDAEKNQFKNEIKKLTDSKDSKSKLLSSVVSDILALSNKPISKVNAKFRIRGFWQMPSAIVTRGTKPQEVVQFRVQYRYLSKDGSETPVEVFKMTESDDKKTAAYSNWIEFKTDARKRTYNYQTNQYIWEIVDVSDADTPNINQMDIPIQYGEKTEIRIKSISEVGWPDSPVESKWSEIISIDFPDNLKDVLNESDFILQEANKEDMIVSMQNELSAKGLDDHLSQTSVVNNKTYNHTSEKILSGFKDSDGVALDLYEYLKMMEDRIRSLEEKIKRAKGELQVVVYRNSDEFIIKNNSEITFNVECEDYLDPYTETGLPTGRVYANNIYLIRDFLLKVKNASVDSALGLLSNRTYEGDSDIYDVGAPQVFWVDDENELISSNSLGYTNTQIDNQFIWMVNYSGLDQTVATKLSDNIGNNFVTANSNSITDVLGSTEFNVGYSEVNSVLSFVGSNNSLLDTTKWIDDSVSVGSTTKLLTTIHPKVGTLENIQETNSDKVRTIDPGENNDVNIPINIYFKMNALDTTKSGLNYNYVNLNNSTKTTKHVKKLKFFLENESENKPFIFTIKFVINRNKVIVQKSIPTTSSRRNVSGSLQSVSTNTGGGGSGIV